LSPDTLLKKIIRPPAIRAGIKGKAIGGHSIHSLATNLRAAGVDLKTTQELLRHANSRVTLDVYTRAISATKREANNRVMEMVFEAGRKKLSAPSSALSRGAKGGNQKRCGPFRFSYFYEIQGQLGTEEVDREVKVSCTADCKYPPAEPEALDFEPLKAVRSLLMPTSLLGLARTNDCAQHLHLSAANRAIVIASIICVAVQHSKTENRGIRPEMSNFYCHPGRAGGSPIWFRSAKSLSTVVQIVSRSTLSY
jgi:hypothetical protein